MLYNLDWLKTGETFPPPSEVARLTRYRQNLQLFDGDHFSTSAHRHLDNAGVSVYDLCARRIAQVVGNFDDVVSFPTLLNYQRLMTLKMADLICGEPPTISGESSDHSQQIEDARDYIDFDTKLYAAVIDISRYGDAVLRVFLDEEGNKNVTTWEPMEWFPIVSPDSTNRITEHVLCWRENVSKDTYSPKWLLHAQVHYKGYYLYKVFELADMSGRIGAQISSSRVLTGIDMNAVIHLKSFSTTNTVYGYDDYMPIDSILAELMARIGQISAILDKHADPNITGPASMLAIDPATGEYRLNAGKFYAVSPGEDQPKYMTWEGQLNAAFKQLELLINQLYILSEMGAALLGSQQGSSQAVSGTAMRFKMVNPLAKARRVANALTRPVRSLFSTLLPEIERKNISVFWSDGLPEDPRENVELIKLATGVTQMIPLEIAITEYFNRSPEEARSWIKKIAKEQEERMIVKDPNRPGPNDGTGINPQKKGSEMGLNDFSGLNNK